MVLAAAGGLSMTLNGTQRRGIAVMAQVAIPFANSFLPHPLPGDQVLALMGGLGLYLGLSTANAIHDRQMTKRKGKVTK